MYGMVGRAHVHCDTEEARSNMSNYPHNGSTLAHWQHTGSDNGSTMSKAAQCRNASYLTRNSPEFSVAPSLGEKHAHFNAVTEQYQCKLYYVNVRIRLDCPPFLAIASLYLRRAGAHTILHERSQNLSHG